MFIFNLTVIIPRAEIRRRSYDKGLLAGTEEILLSKNQFSSMIRAGVNLMKSALAR